jgi:NAD(P)-dependent dehydrogenase (short-subunit alcohol dehydrogenase family)
LRDGRRRNRGASQPVASRHPTKVAALIVMLASKRTASVTGADYVIDGGLIKTT